jgi:hypothetical protein
VDRSLRRVGAAVVALALWCGCASSTTMTSTPRAAPTFGGVSFRTATAVAFGQGEAGTVFADGQSSSGGHAHLRVRVLLDGDSTVRTYDAGSGSALVGPVVWIAGTQAFVAGQACPHWSATAAEQHPDGADLQAVCGDASARILRVDLRTGAWAWVAERLDPRLVPLHPSFRAGTLAALGPDLGAVIDADGEITATDNTALPRDATFTPCAAGDALFAVARSSGPDQHFVGLYELTSRRWVERPVDPSSVLAGSASSRCARDGLVTVATAQAARGASSRHLVSLGPDSIDAAPLPTPTSHGSVTVDSGGSLVFADSATDRAFVYREGAWQALTNVVPDGARGSVVVGKRAWWFAGHLAEPSRVR